MARKTYTLKIVNMTGTVFTTIDDAELGNISWAIYESGAFSFTLPINHPAVPHCIAPTREVQVWRGDDLLWWGVLTKSRLLGLGKITYDCKTLDWYFSRRVVGDVPRVGHFSQPRFEQGWESSWTPTFLPGSVPAANPVASISETQKVEGSHSLALAPSGGRTKATRQNNDLFTTNAGATLSVGGKALIDTIVADTFGDDPRITVNVYYSNNLTAKEALEVTEAQANSIETYILTVKPEARVFAQGLGEANPVATNSTGAGREQNRRAVFIYKDNDAKKGHKQYLGQSVVLRNPVSAKKKLKVTLRAWCYIEEFAGPAANQWGLVLERRHPTKTYSKGPRTGMKKVIQRAVVPITKNTPMNSWLRMDATVHLPPDGRDYVLAAMLFPPNGVSYWDEVDLFTDDALRYADQEESLIIQGLVDHAQDVDAGKSSFNILTDIRPTGIKRSREYRYVMRENVLDALREFPTLHQGAEWDIQVTPTTRTFTTYYPRKSVDRGYTLKYGDNVYDIELDTDNDQTSDQVIVMKEGDDAAREERSVTDSTLLGGLILEKAYDATPGSSLSSLRAQAVRGIERYRDPVIIPTLLTDPRRLDEILDSVVLGDVVDVDIVKGTVEAQGKFRVMSMTLEPNSDHVAVEITPEDEALTTILDWKATGWKYKSQLQDSITGANNTEPVESNVEYADPAYDDTTWATKQSPFGWKHHGTGAVTSAEVEPTSTIPKRHEVWMRRTVQCTEEMYVSVAVDRFAYIYVNGNLLTGTYLKGLNFRARARRGPIRVPDAFLDPSGNQVVALHVQDDLASYGGSNITDFLIADMRIVGIYTP